MAALATAAKGVAEAVKSFFEPKVIQKSVFFRSAEVSATNCHAKGGFLLGRHTETLLILVGTVVGFFDKCLVKSLVEFGVGI